MGKVCTKHMIRLLWKMMENMFFLDSEHVGMGWMVLPKSLVFLLSGRETNSSWGESPPKEYPWGIYLLSMIPEIMRFSNMHIFTDLSKKPQCNLSKHWKVLRKKFGSNSVVMEVLINEPNWMFLLNQFKNWNHLL